MQTQTRLQFSSPNGKFPPAIIIVFLFIYPVTIFSVLFYSGLSTSGVVDDRQSTGQPPLVWLVPLFMIYIICNYVTK